MKIRVAVLHRMLSKVIAEKVLFEEKSEEVREQAIWRKIIQDEETEPDTMRQKCVWHCEKQ